MRNPILKILRILCFVFVFFGLNFLITQNTLAVVGVNREINFQGKVVNKTVGTNVSNGNYDFVFKLYNVSSGGSAIWTETRTGGNQVPVTDGIFQVSLGSVTTFASAAVDFTNDNLWLEITFNGELMGTRIRLSSATYSLFAEQTQGLTIPSGKTITFADAFTTSGAFPLTLTTSASTNVTLPTTGTLSTLAGSEQLTNKTIGSTGLIFSGAGTDINTTGGEALTLVTGNNGSGAAGNVVIDVGTSSAGNGSILIGNAARTQTITIGNSTGGTITIGAGSGSDLVLSDANWSVSGAGAASFVSVSASSAIAANGGITFNDATDTLGAFTMAGTLDINTRTLSGSTGDINYTNFDVVGSSGNTDIGGTITAGSGNEVLTLSTGKIDADALTLVSSGTTGSTSSRSGLQTSSDGLSLLMGCTDGQLLEWTDSGGWACADDNTSAGAGVSTIQEGDSTVDGAANTIDFLAADFIVGSSPAGEANISIDYANSGIVRNTDLTSGDGAGGTSSGSGMEIGTGGIGLLQGCANDEVLKWNESTSVWACGSSLYSKLVSVSSTNLVNDTGNTADQAMTDVDVDSIVAAASSATEALLQVNLDYSTETATSGWHLHVAPNGATLGIDNIVCQIGDDDTTTGLLGCGNIVTVGLDANKIFDYGLDEVNGSSTVVARINLIGYWTPVTTGADLAEYYYAADESINPGDVVSLDPTYPAGIRKSQGRSDETVLGVISTEPGMVLGDIAKGDGVRVLNEEESQNMGERRALPLALAGRVPVNVSIENGPIVAGDYLTASSIPGVAMKATKSGRVLGQALFGHDKSEIGAVMMFVNNTYTNGSFDSENKTSNQILSELVQNTVSPLETDLSEIFTDRVIAGIEMITPKLTVQEINAGLVVADRIQANSIEGLEAMIGRGVFDWLGQRETSNSAATDSASMGEVMGIKEELEKTLTKKIEEYISKWFDTARTFVAEIFFKGKVEFLGGVIFDNDTAGVAVIPPISKSVDVLFEKEYQTEPIVMISLRLIDATQSGNVADDMKAAVSNISTKGFTIVLDEYTPHEIEYNWVAIAVKDGAKRSVGKSLVPNAVSVDEEIVNPTETPEVTPEITPTPTPTPTLEPTPEPIPTPILKYLTILPNEWGHVKIRQERDMESAALGMTYSGNKYVWTEEVDGWYKVVSGEVSGWIMSEYAQKD